MARVRSFLAALACFVLAAAQTVSAGETITYTYDALGRLVATSTAGTAASNGQNVSTTFDPAGNRTNYTVSGVSTGGGGTPTVSINSVSATEGAGASLTFTVSLSAASSNTVTVTYATRNNSALSGTDYTAITTTQLAFGPGQTSKSVTVSLINDSTSETTETMYVDLSGPSGATLGNATGTGTINDDDASSSATLSISNSVNGAEPGTNGVLTVTQSATSNANTIVSLTYSGSATNGADYTGPSTVTIPAGQTSAVVTLSVSDDAQVEGSETAIVSLAAVASGSATIGSPNTATNTIADNDSGGGGGGSIIVPQSYSASSSLWGLSVLSGTGPGMRDGDYSSTYFSTGYETDGWIKMDLGTAQPVGNVVLAAISFWPASSFTNGSVLERSIDDVNWTTVTTVNITDGVANQLPVDATARYLRLKRNSTFYLAVGDFYATAGSGGGGNATLTIADASVTEGGNLVFGVTRSGDTSSAVSVAYTLAGVTATVGSDYSGTFGTVNFAAGQTSASITVPTIDDATVESAETLTATLSSPSSGAVIGSPSSATGTINDNDTASSAALSIGNASTTEGGALAFTVTRSGNTSSAVSASYAASSGSATLGSDFNAASGTVSFAANETSKTISVSTIDDAAVESTENMSVTLSNPSSGATITSSTGTGTIADNDTGGGGGGSIIIPQSYSASSSYSSYGYTGLSGNGAGMRDAVYNTVSSMHGTNYEANAWITMDLGTAQTVGSVVVVPAASSAPGSWGAGYLNSASLERSTDNVNWTTVTASISGAAEGVLTTLPVNATARYLRLKRTNYFLGVGDFYATTGSGGGGGGGGGGTALVPSSCSASSSYSSYGYTGLSGNCSGMRDANYLLLSSVHGTNYEANPWIMMDLGSVQAIGNVALVPADYSAPGSWGPTYVNGVVLERSNDGVNWTQVGAAVSGAAIGVQTVIPVNTTARYLRVRYPGSNYLGLGDFIAYAP